VWGEEGVGEEGVGEEGVGEEGVGEEGVGEEGVALGLLQSPFTTTSLRSSSFSGLFRSPVEPPHSGSQRALTSVAGSPRAPCEPPALRSRCSLRFGVSPGNIWVLRIRSRSRSSAVLFCSVSLPGVSPKRCLRGGDPHRPESAP
jgi:hypothetical protein